MLNAMSLFRLSQAFKSGEAASGKKDTGNDITTYFDISASTGGDQVDIKTKNMEIPVVFRNFTSEEVKKSVDETNESTGRNAMRVASNKDQVVINPENKNEKTGIKVPIVFSDRYSNDEIKKIVDKINTRLGKNFIQFEEN